MLCVILSQQNSSGDNNTQRNTHTGLSMGNCDYPERDTSVQGNSVIGYLVSKIGKIIMQNVAYVDLKMKPQNIFSRVYSN